MSWKSKLAKVLGDTRSKIYDALKGLKYNDLDIKHIEELLISSDIGVHVSSFLAEAIVSSTSNDEAITKLRKLVSDILLPASCPIQLSDSNKPHVILLCGVNGVGKTTTAGKIAYQYNNLGRKVALVAADTFRAAAKEQLQIWGERVGCEVFTGRGKSDPASVVYSAMESAKCDGKDLLIIDTAGRLQSKANLMGELKKIRNVISKHDLSAPHDTVLVLDATTGQNAFSQVDAFNKIVNLTGLIITKMDGTAKGGVLIGLAKMYPHIKINMIGIGEAIDDLSVFIYQDFVDGILSEKEMA